MWQPSLLTSTTTERLQGRGPQGDRAPRRGRVQGHDQEGAAGGKPEDREGARTPRVEGERDGEEPRQAHREACRGVTLRDRAGHRVKLGSARLAPGKACCGSSAAARRAGSGSSASRAGCSPAVSGLSGITAGTSCGSWAPTGPCSLARGTGGSGRSNGSSSQLAVRSWQSVELSSMTDSLRARVEALPGMDRLLPALDGLDPSYLVGGAVRDLLLGAPSVDLDLAVEGDAPAVATGGGGPPRRRGRDARTVRHGDRAGGRLHGRPGLDPPGDVRASRGPADGGARRSGRGPAAARLHDERDGDRADGAGPRGSCTTRTAGGATSRPARCRDAARAQLPRRPHPHPAGAALRGAPGLCHQLHHRAPCARGGGGRCAGHRVGGPCARRAAGSARRGGGAVRGRANGPP